MEISIKSLEPGQHYILQARAKGTNGQVSGWSTAFDLLTQSDVTAPDPVTALMFDSVGTAFKASWTAPTTDSDGNVLKDFKDYQVEVSGGVSSQIYFTVDTHFDFTLENNVNAFGSPEPNLTITVKVRDLAGNLSTGVSDTASNPIPVNLTGFSASGMIGGVYLKWDASSEGDFKQYEVYSGSTVDFAPAEAGKIYTGSATNFIYASNVAVEVFFKARQLDVFNQGSGYVSGSATPQTSTDVDVSPADAPTNVHATSAVGIDGRSSIDITWDAVVNTKLSDYVVRYGLTGSEWVYVTVPGDQTEVVVNGLLPNTPYYIGVASETFANAKSTFTSAAESPLTTAADTTAPSKPSTPTVSTNTMSIQISHDMTKASGGNLEADVAYLEIHRGITDTFTASSSTLVNTINSGGQGIVVSEVIDAPVTDSDTSVYWRVIAVDKSNNKSTASDAIAGVPGLVENVNIANATITSAKINDLEANKITAGTGIINNLDVKSELTLGAGGHLKSSDFDSGTQTGFDLSTGGLTIYDGDIYAKSLLLQDSNNILPPAWADFEFNPSYYSDVNGVVNAVIGTSSVDVRVAMDSINEKFGRQCMRIYNLSISNPYTEVLYFASGGATTTGCNIDVNPGEYIFSGYFKGNSGHDQTVKLGLFVDTPAAVQSTNFVISGSSWTRFSAVLTVPAGAQKAKAFLEFGPSVSTTGYDFFIDGMMLERKLTAETTPSAYKPPSSTAIDGGQIVTGSIISSSPSVTWPNEPAWSINTAGNAQLGDVLVHGSMVVGDTTDAFSNIMPARFSSWEYPEDFYADASNNANIANFNPNSNIPTKVDIVNTPHDGTQCVRVWNNSLPAGDGAGIYLGFFQNAAGNNIKVTAGQTYMFSAYVKSANSTVFTNTAALAIWTPLFFVPVGSPKNDGILISDSNWTRIYGTWKAPFGVNSIQLVVWLEATGSSVGFDVLIDSVMVEPFIDGMIEPSPYSIGVDSVSYINSGNYITGQSGWSLDNYGNVEFNNGTFRGEVDIAASLGAQPIDTQISNSVAVWRSSLYDIDTVLSGIEPVIHMNGAQFAPDGSGGVEFLKPTQVVFRMTPEGGFQLMADQSDETFIFDTDGNNDIDATFNRRDAYHSYGDLRIGPGVSRDFNNSLASTYFGIPPDNAMYGQMHLLSRTGYNESQANVASDIVQQTNSSSNYGDFRPWANTQLISQATMNYQNANKMPGTWDVISNAYTYYNTNSVRTKITFTSVDTTVGNIYQPGVFKGLVASITTAGTGTYPGVTFAPTATTYNVTGLTAGEQYIMCMQAAFGIPLLGVQLQFYMNFSDGTTQYSEAISLAGDTATGDYLNVVTMTPNVVFTVPNGVTTANVGFRFYNGSYTDTTFTISQIQLHKFKNSDGNGGEWGSTFSPYVFTPTGAHLNGEGYAGIQANASSFSSDYFPSGTNIYFYTHFYDYIDSSKNKTLQMGIDPANGISIYGGNPATNVIKTGNTWQSMTIQNSGTVWAGIEPACIITIDNKVLLRGGANYSTAAAPGAARTVCILPDGYRPSVEQAAICAATGSINTPVKIRIQTDGQVQIYGGLTVGSGNQQGVVLSGIEFPLY